MVAFQCGLVMVLKLLGSALFYRLILLIVFIWVSLHAIVLCMYCFEYTKKNSVFRLLSRYFGAVNAFYFVLGLYPLTDSFNFLQPDYIRSFGLNHSFVPGFASHLQSNFLNTMYMGYCLQSQEVTCNAEALRTVVCKVHCKLTLRTVFYHSKHTLKLTVSKCFCFF